jgi:hypothetical protein
MTAPGAPSSSDSAYSADGVPDGVLHLAIRLGSLGISVEEEVRPGDLGQPAAFHRATAAILASLPQPQGSPAPSGPEPASEPAPSSPQPVDEVRPGSNPLWDERLRYAFEAGASALLRLRGDRAPQPTARRCSLQSRVYVLLRDKDNRRPPTGALLFHRWANLRNKVFSDFVSPGSVRCDIAESSVFHGWPSRAEAAQYAQGAGAVLADWSWES